MTRLRQVVRRGTWQPDIPRRYRRTLSVLLALTPIVLGVDFLLGKTGDLSVVERSMPTAIWGALLIVAGLTTSTGYVLRYPWVCIAGLHLSGVLCAALAVGVAWDRIDYQGGFRGPWLYLMAACPCWCYALGYVDQIRTDRGDRR